jgi:hypothetical protein
VPWLGVAAGWDIQPGRQLVASGWLYQTLFQAAKGFCAAVLVVTVASAESTHRADGLPLRRCARAGPAAAGPPPAVGAALSRRPGAVSKHQGCCRRWGTTAASAARWGRRRPGPSRPSTGPNPRPYFDPPAAGSRIPPNLRPRPLHVWIRAHGRRALLARVAREAAGCDALVACKSAPTSAHTPGADRSSDG